MQNWNANLMKWLVTIMRSFSRAFDDMFDEDIDVVCNGMVIGKAKLRQQPDGNIMVITDDNELKSMISHDVVFKMEVQNNRKRSNYDGSVTSHNKPIKKFSMEVSANAKDSRYTDGEANTKGCNAIKWVNKSSR